MFSSARRWVSGGSLPAAVSTVAASQSECSRAQRPPLQSGSETRGGSETLGGSSGSGGRKRKRPPTSTVRCLEYDNWEKRLPPPQIYRGAEFYPTPTRFFPRLGLQQGAGKKFRAGRLRAGVLSSRRALVESFLTPNELFFCRFGRLPEEPDVSWRLQVESVSEKAQIVTVPAFPVAASVYHGPQEGVSVLGAGARSRSQEFGGGGMNSGPYGIGNPTATATSPMQDVFSFSSQENAAEGGEGASSSSSSASSASNSNSKQYPTMQKRVLDLTLEDLRERFKQHDVVCTMDCSANPPGVRRGQRW
eukprot:g15069.t1